MINKPHPPAPSPSKGEGVSEGKNPFSPLFPREGPGVSYFG